MDQKQIIHRYLSIQRDALLAKLEGLGERDVRWPMTPTGTNLLGLVKPMHQPKNSHVATGYVSWGSANTGRGVGRPVARVR